MSLDDKLRAAIRADMQASGIPASDISETLDLAFHAASVAVARLCEICETGSRPLVCSNAFSLAVSVAAMRLEFAARDIAEEIDREGTGHCFSLAVVQGEAAQ